MFGRFVTFAVPSGQIHIGEKNLSPGAIFMTVPDFSNLFTLCLPRKRLSFSSSFPSPLEIGRKLMGKNHRMFCCIGIQQSMS